LISHKKAQKAHKRKSNSSVLVCLNLFVPFVSFCG